ncbi:MAG: 3-hydroxyacyl-ACP dehydratase FabZ [Lactobacillaceae bacterium]|jgi:beta-hydroxyacyl-ACP dehydratase FabZ|nr:3-hydroxyacyl-ACP dehydratase FabZ [Lactobacillaceae bacterium]
MSENKVYHIEDIMKFLPHRYPFLLVDRLVVEEMGVKGYGIKNVTMNEEFFQGHFPGNPIMPGVLQVEAMAQTAGAIIVSAKEDAQGKAGVLFMSIDGVKFRKPVKPGDRLEMHVEKIKDKGRIFVFRGECFVDGKVVSEAEFTAMIIVEK